MQQFKKYAILIGGITLLSILIILVSTEFTSQPGFCSSCHYMESYVDAWEMSSHSDVTCTDCHFPPGYMNKLKGKFTALSMAVNYMTGVYKRGKPHAEIDDASCLRSGCHQERLLEGRTIYKENIIFNHTSHLGELRREKKLRCTSCHSQIVQGKHMTVTETTCFLCHFKNTPDESPINDCKWCHDAPVQTDTSNVIYNHQSILDRAIGCDKCHGSMKVGEGDVPFDRCSLCHSEKGKLDQYSNIEFIHKNHVTDHKVECQNCHQLIYHESIAKSKDMVPDCQACHTETHQTQLGLFSGTAGVNVPHKPDHMFEAGLNCQGCHIWSEDLTELPEFGHTIVAKGKSCEQCHFEGEFDRRLEMWQAVMQEKITLIEKMIESVEEELLIYSRDKSIPDNTNTLLHDAKYNFQIVKIGNVVHNVSYSDDLLKGSYDALYQILKDINSSTPLPQFSTYSEMIPSECKWCHYGQEEISVHAFGIDFSHNRHVAKNLIECTKCHSNTIEHGQTILKKSDCLDCHHTQDENECSTCHSTQMQFYDGSIAIAAEHYSDVMYDADIHCSECHSDDDGSIQKCEVQVCSDCHEDEEYADMAHEWQNEIKDNVEFIQQKLDELDHTILNQNQKFIVNKISLGIEFILKDKSSGVHNYELVSQLLTDYIDSLNRIPL